MQLLTLIVRRIVLTIPLLLLIVFMTFMLVRLGGQDPVHLLAGPTAGPSEIAAIRAELGLDKSLWVQFAVYLGNLLKGDLGNSWLTGTPVLTDLVTRAPATLELMILGIGLGTAVGIPLGLRSANRPGGVFDQLTRGFTMLGFSLPTYWLGLLLMFIFFYLLGWAPPGMGRISLMLTPPPVVTGSILLDALIAGDMEAAHSAFSQLVLPVLCIAILCTAPIVRQTRAIAMEFMASDAYRFSRSCGLSASLRRRMVLSNSSTPLVTFVATELTSVVGTVSLIEYVFSWGGIGQYGLAAIASGDFSAVQGYVAAMAFFAALVLLVSDLLIIITEPRAGARA